MNDQDVGEMVTSDRLDPSLSMVNEPLTAVPLKSLDSVKDGPWYW